MNANAVEGAKQLGEVFAATINGSQDAANWHRLDPRDDVPQPDYIALSKQFGGCTREMKVAYREGFNGVFKPVNRA